MTGPAVPETDAAHGDDVPETYDGDLEIDDGTERFTVEAHLSGFFQPIDGSFHWQGRINPDPRVRDVANRIGRKPIAVRVPGGTWATARLGEQNPWGGYRIAGLGRPPFPLQPVEVHPGR